MSVRIEKVTNYGGFNLKLASILSGFSKLAYSTNEPGTRLFFRESNIEGILVQYEGYNVVAFRGTELDVEDWLTDLDCKKNNELGVNVHNGFFKAATKALVGVKTSLRSLGLTGQSPIIFTGHSLGGAIAILAAYMFSLENSYQTAWVYTFGAPRVGGKEFAKEYNRILGDMTFRVNNGADIVPRVPTRFMGYAHVGQEIYIDPWGGIHGGMNLCVKVAMNIFQRIKHRLWHPASWKTAGIKCHSIDKYHESLSIWHDE